MSKKVKVGTLQRRFNVKPMKTEGIVSYDDDNAYPQRVLYTIAASGVGVSCVNLYAKYIQGQGFVDTNFYKAIVNRFGLTNDELLRQCSLDYARFKGFAIHVKYNALLQVNELSWIPFWWCRKSIPDADNYSPQVVVYDDWDRARLRTISKDKLTTLPLFNPDTEIIAKQIETAGGYDKFKGQIFYYSANGNEYPVAPCDAVLMDLETDSQIQTYNWTSVKTGFINQTIMTVLGEFKDDQEKAEYVKGIMDWQGAENSNSIIVLEAKTKDDIPDIKPLTTNINDKLFAFTKESIMQSIIQSYGQPKILLSIETAGSLSDASKINESKEYYDEYTSDERVLFESLWLKLFATWHEPVTTNFSIKPLTNYRQKTLVKSVGLDGVKSITELLLSALSPQQKINALILSFGVSSENANALVNGTPLNTES